MGIIFPLILGGFYA